MEFPDGTPIELHDLYLIAYVKDSLSDVNGRTLFSCLFIGKVVLGPPVVIV